MTHVREDSLLHCLHRLSSLLSSRRVLLGAGRTESHCADCLDQLAGCLSNAQYSCCLTIYLFINFCSCQAIHCAELLLFYCLWQINLILIYYYTPAALYSHLTNFSLIVHSSPLNLAKDP